jgi:LPS-assembly protein
MRHYSSKSIHALLMSAVRKYRPFIHAFTCAALLCVSSPSSGQLIAGEVSYFEPEIQTKPVGISLSPMPTFLGHDVMNTPPEAAWPLPVSPPHIYDPRSLAMFDAGSHQSVLEQSVTDSTLQLDPQMSPSPRINEPQAQGSIEQNEPVDLEADSLGYDNEQGLIVAEGNVELVQAGRILRAERVSYNQKTDEVIASGNVVLNEPNGDVHFMDEVRLRDEMRQGFVSEIQSYLADGGQFTAKSGERKNATLLTMYDASYTPCECEGDKNGNPTWQIRASEVTIDEEANRIRYKDARFELFGVPVAYTPYLSHPDGKVKRKSGLMSPSIGFDSDLGLILTQNYFVDIAQNRDATVGLMLTTREVPVGLAEYRHRFTNAELILNASGTYANREDSVAGVTVQTEEEFRGHIKGEGLWDITEKWRSGFNLSVASDDQYLREYDFSSEDVLQNRVYAERFSGRHYFTAQLLGFQDVRVEEEQTDQPNILPEIEASFLGDPNDTLGGRWSLDISSLALHREDGQDMTRLVTDAGWARQYVTNFGLVNTLDVSARGDVYWVSDRDLAVNQNGRSNNAEATRGFVQAHMVSRYPLVKDMSRMQAMIEPIAAITLAPNIDSENDAIPNEDSQDVQLDASNLFEPDRFPGLDRIEDRSRATYGARAGLYGYGGSYGEVFAGQSYNFDDGDNPFPDGSGLSRQESDFVGQISGGYDNRYFANYRFQIESDNLNSQRHEFDGSVDFGRLNLSTRYLFAKSLEGTDIDDSREQARFGASFDVTKQWRVRGHVLQDLGEDPGLREASIGLDYFGCCISFSLTGERTNTSDASGDSGTDILFRIGLKGLGEFETNNTSDWDGSN